MLRPLYIFTGMDGCGKSTRVSELEKEKNLKYSMRGIYLLV